MSSHFPGTNDVTFTQYVRPNGRRQEIWIEQTPAYVAAAKKIKEAGYKFEIEVLTTGHISMTIEPKRLDENGEDLPIAHEICANGPPVPLTVQKLIARAAEVLSIEVV